MGCLSTATQYDLSVDKKRYPTFSYWLEKTRYNNPLYQPGGINWKAARTVDIAFKRYPKEAIDPNWRPEEPLSAFGTVYLEGRSPSGKTEKSKRRKVPPLRGTRGLGLAARRRGNVILGVRETLG